MRKHRWSSLRSPDGRVIAGQSWEKDTVKHLGIAALSLVAFAVTDDLSAQEKKKATRSPAENTVIAQVRKLGGHVLEIAQDDPRVEVAYHLATDKVTDAHLAPLKGLKSMVALNLRGTEITDAGLASIAGLTGLQKLHLEKTKITDKGLTHLKGLAGLEYLNLYGTQVTDAGLANLQGLKKLKKLYLWQTKATDAGVAKLKKSLPGVTIVRELKIAIPAPPKKADPKKKPAVKKPAPKKPAVKKKKGKGKKKPDAKKKDAPKKKDA
jgi:hypothetical protein